MGVNNPYRATSDGLRSLIIQYAPGHARAGVSALLELDTRLGSILRTTREPMVGQMRLTWWHDAVSRLGAGPPPAEPILATLAVEVLPHGVTGTTLAGMIDGWEILLGDDPISDEDLANYATARGGTLFTAIGGLCGAADSDPIRSAGEGWALADLARHVSDPVLAERANAMAAPRGATPRRRWSRNGRALGALALLADRPEAGPATVARLFWHRLSGL